MSEVVKRIEEFVAYASKLDGDEKGEAQVFCDRLFKAFGHDGYKEAGATLEFRIKSEAKGVNFADLMWKPRLLIEMKKRGVNLFHHYKQAFNYWVHAVPDRPRYVLLCNFDSFWIYDFDKQIAEPVDVVKIEDLPKRYTALNFLFKENKAPQFGNDREAVSREAADKIAALFNLLVGRKVPREEAQRFILQLVVALFSEDIDLLPAGTVLGIAEDCLEKDQSSFDLFKGLFDQMNSPKPAKGGRFVNVPYFNGGLFAKVFGIELKASELELVGGDDGVARSDWSKVNPAIFGTIFQQSMDAKRRHAYGAHFTSEADILRVVQPTIVQPWMERIALADSMKELIALRKELFSFKVLDPACGSGNFLYVSYRELVRVEVALLEKLRQSVAKKTFDEHVKALSVISPKQFFGIDRDEFGVELAKVTLVLAKKLALDEAEFALERDQIELPLEEEALPLDNLDDNIQVGDALFDKWPKIDAIVGNPPYQSKNKMQDELGREYVAAIREAYPDIPGHADYCVYWFRRAHDHLKEGQRAGLVGTNTIRQNYSREGGLDYIVDAGGTITEAISTMRWSGEANVDVSIVNWIKGEAPGLKKLYWQHGADTSAGWEVAEVEEINSALSAEVDVKSAKTIRANAASGQCFQGQTHGHEGFLLPMDEAKEAVKADPQLRDVLFPFLIANELIGRTDSLPRRCVIDFADASIFEAKKYSVFKTVQTQVLPTREEAAAKEEKENKALLAKDPDARVNWHHRNFLRNWWKLSYRREAMLDALSGKDRYIACGRITLRPIFEFISTQIRPNDALAVFPYEDDYSFGILQSDIHWQWFINKCSTMRDGFYRYTSNTVFDSFPWPQSPSAKQIRDVAKAAVTLRKLRNGLRGEGNSLREMYRMLELPGTSELSEAHNKLDEAVRKAYGATPKQSMLKFLLELNEELAEAEDAGKEVQGPGLHPNADSDFITDDCVFMKL
jgi:hypothetical protein